MTLVKGQGKQFVAFVSHMKMEAAAEARLCQMELEKLFHEPLFLDSDDLRRLDRLVEHVRESACVLLLQTESVLTRPYCLLELYTAIESSIPIVGVTVRGRFQYDFARARAYLMHLDTVLEEANPGASELLRKHGVDLLDAAYKLSTRIPAIISVELNAHASRNMLQAAFHDIAENMVIVSSCEAQVPPASDAKAKWLADRASVSIPTAPYQHGLLPEPKILLGRVGRMQRTDSIDSMPMDKMDSTRVTKLDSMRMTKTASNKDEMDSMHSNWTTPRMDSMRRMDSMDSTPMVKMDSLRMTKMDSMDSMRMTKTDSMRMVSLASIPSSADFVRMEAGSGLLQLAKRPIAGLSAVAFKLQSVTQAAARAHHLVDECETFVVLSHHLEQVLVGMGDELEKHPERDDVLKILSTLLSKALRAIRPLANPNFDTNSTDVALFPEICGELHEVASKLQAPLKVVCGDGDSSSGGPLQVDVQKLKEEVVAQQVVRATAADPYQNKVFERQNRLLRSQCHQMEAMFEHHQMETDEFMQKFPLPDNEAERLEMLSKLGLMTIQLPNLDLEAIVDETVEDETLWGALTVCYVIVMGESMLRILAMRTRNEDGNFIGHSTQTLPFFPRKIVPCQYSVATGAITCFNRKSQEDATKVDPVGQMMKYEKALGAVDPGFSAEAKRNFMSPCEPQAQRMRDLHMKHLGTSTNMLPFMCYKIADKFVGPPNVTHFGFPIRACGHVVGTFCCMFSDLEGDGPSQMQRSFIETQALRTGRLFESESMGHRSYA
jgi:hypothetical protein